MDYLRVFHDNPPMLFTPLHAHVEPGSREGYSECRCTIGVVILVSSNQYCGRGLVYSNKDFTSIIKVPAVGGFLIYIIVPVEVIKFLKLVLHDLYAGMSE